MGDPFSVVYLNSSHYWIVLSYAVTTACAAVFSFGVNG